MLNQIDEATPVLSRDSDDHSLEIQNLIDKPTEQVNLNDPNNLIETLKNTLKEVPEVNEARVLYFKSAIALGHYQIDCDKIAAQMMRPECATN